MRASSLSCSLATAAAAGAAVVAPPPKPSRALDAGPVRLDVHPVGAPLHAGDVARPETPGGVQLLPQGHDEAVQVRDVDASVAPHGRLEAGVGLVRQGVGGLVGEERVLDRRAGVEGVPDAQQNTGQ
eukprot:CAMPEP_0194289522 /NCGR_PEP_ID=MMETSP0169-20130528/39233_1 /TAXON_ID=218684 /ORGANISM="Corethron pennatum, Strain L29A3" /LENGTH=126 /DNA_ID=CAMNT_0039036825 /DNA_START=149 /DNA_END=525 /DNA_ORIENTATION=-